MWIIQTNETSSSLQCGPWFEMKTLRW